MSNMFHCKKIVILGGESTGKSTLCAHLAAYYKTVWVREYAREYLEKLNRAYVEKDLLAIAKGQLKQEAEALENAKQFLFCDTDLHVLKVWSEYKYNHCHSFILSQLEQHSYDGYILTSPDFPWQPDPLREHPEPALRDYFFKRYIELIKLTNLPYCIVHGNEEERMKTAIEFLEIFYKQPT